jgi:hypothetical protein
MQESGFTSSIEIRSEFRIILRNRVSGLGKQDRVALNPRILN